MINSKEITNLYLYGTKNKPSELVDDALIRPETPDSINLDTHTLMSTGAGRFAIGRQFERINDFFTASSTVLPAGT